MLNKIQKNHKNEVRVEIRTDSNKFTALVEDAKKEKKSINLKLNEILALHYGINA